MASSINKYAQNVARARYQTQGGTRSVPVSGRTGATIDPSLFAGKSAAPKGATLQSRPIEGGPALPSPKAYNPIIDAESGEDPNAPRVETQQPIENRGGSARYMIQGGGPKIDLSFLVPERANKAFDPSKAIGGENVPFQESKGVGGFFRRMLGDESNQQNIAAQQAQGAEWRQEAKELKAEERLLNRMREADKPTQARFEASQTASRESEANRVAAENKRLELEGERVGLTKQQIEDARLDRIARLEAEKLERDARIEDMRTRNALADYTVGLNQLKSNQPQMIGLSGGGMGVFDPRSGSVSIVNPGTAGFGDKFPGTPSTTRQVYPPPQFKPSGSGGGQVDRTTGATLGGPLPVDAGAAVTPKVTAPPRSGLMDMIGAGAENVAGALDLEGMSQIPAALGDLLTRDPKEIQKAARSRARYMDPSMQRTF